MNHDTPQSAWEALPSLTPPLDRRPYDVIIDGKIAAQMRWNKTGFRFEVAAAFIGQCGVEPAGDGDEWDARVFYPKGAEIRYLDSEAA